MAMAVGVMSGGRWIHQKESLKTKREGVRCSSISSPSVKYPYMTLGISRDASEKDVKKAFRQLAKQYHPDVCKENNCGVLFHRINEAYDVVMANLRGETDYNLFESQKQKAADDYYVDDEEDEWLGWDGAGMWDYASRMNTMEC